MGRRAMDFKDADPKGLVRESYNIDGISTAECGSIFFDWVLSLPQGVDTLDCLRSLLAHYGLPNPDHPMTKVLTEALTTPLEPKRRGGRAGRFASP